MVRKFFSAIFYVCLLIGLVGLVAVGAVGTYYYLQITKDLPQISSLNDYQPKAVTALYAGDGTLLSEVFDERRYPVKFEDIPLRVRQAFLAAEDANFYSHPGVDLVSVFRAMWVNLTKRSVRQGASTITQQIVKSLLLSREKTFQRKVKEAILSYRLEKALKKDEIFSIYLNEIYLGSGSYGVRAAAKVHFHKELKDLSVAEAAYIAGMPQKPGELSRPEHRAAALRRQHYVLQQMRRNDFIDQQEFQRAEQEELRIYLPEEQTVFAAPYFAVYASHKLDDIFTQIGLTGAARSPGGYSVEVSVDVKASELARLALQRGLRDVDKREGWRGPLQQLTTKDELERFLNQQTAEIEPDEVYKAVVSKVNFKDGTVEVVVQKTRTTINLSKVEWAKRLRKDDSVIGVDPMRLLRTGDVVEVSVEPSAADAGAPNAPGQEASKQVSPKFRLDQTPELEGAMVVVNALSGEVVAMIGGYDFRRSQFNRAVQAERQPGSSFKPFVYLSALESLGYTPATIVPDTPISLNAGDGKVWTPGNFDNKFLGPITLRTALERSRNVVSVHLIQRLGIERVQNTAKRLGITTPIPKNLSISLGSAEVRMIELVRAYGAFAAGGYLADELVIKSIKDRAGNVVYRQRPRQRRVIDENTAFLMAWMMKGVVDRGTATVVKKLGRSVAGKTGTTNDQMDAWFIGYTPEWVAGVWVGFDQKKTIGRLETGGKAAAPIYVNFMQQFLSSTPLSLDFDIPDGVVPVSIDIHSGGLVRDDDPGAFTEYFKIGSEPTGYGNSGGSGTNEYLSSGEF